MKNPLLLNTELLPNFSAIKAEHIEPAIDFILEKNKKKLTQILANTQPSFESVVQPLEDMDVELANVWGVVEHLHNVKNIPEFRAPYEAALEKITAYQLELGQNNALFHLFQIIAQTQEQKLNSVQKKVLEDHLLDFKLSGINLPEQQKKEFLETQQQCSKASTEFDNHLLDATEAWSLLIKDENQLQGIPEHTLTEAKNRAQQQKETGWLLKLDFPTYYSVISYAQNRELRQKIYYAYVTRASAEAHNHPKFDNTKIMEQLLNLRQKTAGLLGYKTYAALSLAKKMAKSPEDVIDFLEQLANKSHPIAQKEYAELKRYAQEKYAITDVAAWDIAFLSEKLRQERFSINDEILRVYFPLKKVLQGLFEIIQTLFGIRIKNVENKNVWHPDVSYYQLYDSRDQLIGSLYLDLYARNQKRSGAWMDSCRVRHQFMNNDLLLPIAYIVCNFTPSSESHGSLLTHDEVQTLFHECGHALHHLLTQQNINSISGIHGVPWDGVEFPSQFMENFCWQPETLALISAHVETGKSLPKELIDKLIDAKNFQSAMMMVRQIEFSLFDFLIHAQEHFDAPDFIQRTLNNVRQKVSVVPVPVFNRFQHSFSHIFAGGYAAGYYSYKWAEVLSADAFSLFKNQGILNAELGHAYRHKILAKGGSEDFLANFIDFMGRKPDVNALLIQDGIIEAQ